MTLEEYRSYMQQLAQDANDQKQRQEIIAIKRDYKSGAKLIRKTFSKTNRHAKSRF